MRATYRALCSAGYSELTAQSIADRTDRSKASLFYHYDSKEGLLGAFIDYLLEDFDERVERTRAASPEDRLAAFVDWWFVDPPEAEVGYHTAMLELRAQAPYNDTLREKLRESDAALRATLVEILADGIATGAFREHEPETVADLLLAAFDGARIRRLTLDRDAYKETVRGAIDDYVFADVLAPETEYPAEPTVSFRSDGTLTDATDSDLSAGAHDRPADDDERPADDDERPADDDERPADDDERPADDDRRTSNDTSRSANEVEQPSDDAGGDGAE